MTNAFMARALDLARQAQGSTSPNPPVGAVLVKGDRIVGEGYTRPPGGPHAEVVALDAAGSEAQGSALYTTLEPCAHWGRTPPCAQALINAGIRAVHASLRDPNPLVNGKGIRQLEEHGIPVFLGEGADDAAELVEAHTKFTTSGIPYVTLSCEAETQVLAALKRAADVMLTDLPHNLAGWPGPAVLWGPDGRWTILPQQRDQPGAAYESGDAIADLLLRLGRGAITSCIALGSPAWAGSLLATGLVDKVVGRSDMPVPPGFTRARLTSEPVPHAVLYRTPGNETGGGPCSPASLRR